MLIIHLQNIIQEMFFPLKFRRFLKLQQFFIYYMTQQQSIKKAQRIILDFNKSGLEYLGNQKTYHESYDYLKKAQKTVLDQLKINPQNAKINQLAGITYNNFACYYKKTNKPKVALTYLKKALQIQVFKVENWISTASTHLNICAIYSYINKHQEASEHAGLSIKMLEKVNLQQIKDKPEQQKSYWHIKMLAHYNQAIEFQHLKNYQESLKYYRLTKEQISKNSKKNQTLFAKCQENIKRVQNQQILHKKKLIQIIAKRKQNQQKGNHQFMRKNKKNYKKEGEDEWRSVLNSKKYQNYKAQTQPNRKYKSAQKFVKLKPIDIYKNKEKSQSSLHKE